MTALMQQYPPIDLKDPKLRRLARALGPAWIRVSGTWATKTYYDLDDAAGGKAPAGYESVLTKAQWTELLDFVRAVDGKLLVSVSNCAGDHPGGGPLDLTQTRKLFTFSRAYGVPISAAEFMNQPNGLAMAGAPKGYTPADYARDQDIFCAWVRENEPECLLVGPCTTGDPTATGGEPRGFGAAVVLMTNACTTQALLEGTKVPLDVFSYHFYNGVSERLAPAVPSAHWPAELAHTDEYLAAAPKQARIHAALRDRFVPGAPLWLTESGDAGGGGNTWASTYLDVFRTLNELGSFATISDGVIFHNTLASSDYGFLQHGSFDPRPNYYAVLLWNRLMGTEVYDSSHLAGENLHIYCHSRRDGRRGYAFLVINNSLTSAVNAELPGEALRYTLTADFLRATTMRLNGKELALSGKDGLPDLPPVLQDKGEVSLPRASCTFLLL